MLFKLLAIALAALTPTVDSDGDVGWFTSLALTSDNRIYISHYDLTNDTLKLTQCHNPDCTSHTLTTVNSNLGMYGGYTSLALTSDNLPYISYRDGTKYTLKLAQCHNPDCTNHTLTTVDSVGWYGGYTSLALTSDDLPYISYHDDANDTLKLTQCHNPDCTNHTLTTVDSVGWYGGYTSLTLTSDDLPYISYYDYTNHNLKLAQCHNPNCTSHTQTIVDSDGDVGWYTSLALTSDNRSYISYYDDTNSNLKLAQCQLTTKATRGMLSIKVGIGLVSVLGVSYLLRRLDKPKDRDVLKTEILLPAVQHGLPALKEEEVLSKSKDVAVPAPKCVDNLRLMK